VALEARLAWGWGLDWVGGLATALGLDRAWARAWGAAPGFGPALALAVALEQACASVLARELGCALAQEWVVALLAA